MDEEDTFWCLAIIVEELLPGYFSMAMVEPQVPLPLPLPSLPPPPTALLQYVPAAEQSQVTAFCWQFAAGKVTCCLHKGKGSICLMGLQV